ncbi:MAG: hypothetical protein JNL28_03745 [Planctomycetes bacterium]|nr:hypothetical protein [Planctomycetota bacterium]
MSDQNTQSTSTSLWPGVLLLFFGLLIVAYACLAVRNGLPIIFSGLGWILGPILVFIGVGALARSRGNGSANSSSDRP